MKFTEYINNPEQNAIHFFSFKKIPFKHFAFQQFLHLLLFISNQKITWYNEIPAPF